MTFLYLLTVFILSCFIGYFVVQGVTPALYAPLMSVSNAISGIVIVAALSAAAFSDSFDITEILSLLSIFFAGLNVFGGFAVSARMLQMFTKRKTDK